MAMRTAYIGPFQADMNDQSGTAKMELRVEPSEAMPGRLAIGVYGHSTGKEYVLAHLSPAMVAELVAAIDEWRPE